VPGDSRPSRTLKGIGPEFASLLWLEALFRGSGAQQRALKTSAHIPPQLRQPTPEAATGDWPGPWAEQAIERGQGISKSGNHRLPRTNDQACLAVAASSAEALSRWFLARVSDAKGQIRRIAIVALARKLLVGLVALCHPRRRSRGRAQGGMIQWLDLRQ
jgi:transposase